MLTHELDHAGKALARLAEQFKEKPKLAALIAAFTTQAQSAEEALWQLFTLRWIDTASGPQLDVIGKIVKQPRDNSADDDEYRVRIKARVRCNLSSGTIANIYAVFRILQPTAFLLFTQGNVAAFTFLVGAPLTAAYAKLYAGFLGDAKGAGIGGGLLWQSDVDTAMFTCDVATFLTADCFAGDTVISVVSTSLFPPTGSLVLDRWLASSDELTYTHKDATHFYLGTGGLADDHVQRAAVSWLAAPGLGFSSTSNPTSGGQLAGVIAS